MVPITPKIFQMEISSTTLGGRKCETETKDWRKSFRKAWGMGTVAYSPSFQRLYKSLPAAQRYRDLPQNGVQLIPGVKCGITIHVTVGTALELARDRNLTLSAIRVFSKVLERTRNME